jgi:hypothetical protein
MTDKPTKTTPWKYYHFFVEPNYYDFANMEESIARGFNACVPAFQLADIFYRYYARHDPTKISDWKKLKEFHIHLSSIEPHFTTIQSVTFVYKHLYTTKGHYNIGSPMSLDGLLSRRLEITTDWDNDKAFKGRVVVRKKDQTRSHLIDALNAVVLEMWPRVLPPEPGEDW